MELIERATGGLLLAATAGGSALAMSLFDAKSELVQGSRALVTDLRDQIQGLNRLDRTQRLVAGHAVLVAGSYFGSRSAVTLPISGKALETRTSEQISSAGGDRPNGRRLGELGRALLHSGVPTPSPQQPPEALIEELQRFYRKLSESVETFLSGLAIGRTSTRTPGRGSCRSWTATWWLGLSRTIRWGFRRLAGDVPKFGFWVNLLDHQATRDGVREVKAGVE